MPVRALEGRVHPHYGVFAPVRAEHVDLVAAALEGRDLAGSLAFDVGTGTGVLALLLARRGARVVATDREPRAVACARENAARFGLAGRIEVAEADLFPAGLADLVVCNPPWLPDQPHGLLDRAVYDPGSAMLLGFLAGLPAHLRPGGEGWLVLSDLAEMVGLRPAGILSGAFARSGLAVGHVWHDPGCHLGQRQAERVQSAAQAVGQADRLFWPSTYVLAYRQVGPCILTVCRFARLPLRSACPGRAGSRKNTGLAQPGTWDGPPNAGRG